MTQGSERDFLVTCEVPVIVGSYIITNPFTLDMFVIQNIFLSRLIAHRLHSKQLFLPKAFILLQMF